MLIQIISLSLVKVGGQCRTNPIKMDLAQTNNKQQTNRLEGGFMFDPRTLTRYPIMREVVQDQNCQNCEPRVREMAQTSLEICGVFAPSFSKMTGKSPSFPESMTIFTTRTRFERLLCLETSFSTLLLLLCFTSTSTADTSVTEV